MLPVTRSIVKSTGKLVEPIKKSVGCLIPFGGVIPFFCPRQKENVR